MLHRRNVLVGGTVAALAAPAVTRASQRRDTAVAAIERWAADQKIPGLAVALVEEGKTTYARGLGVRSTETRDPMTADALIRVGSVAKAFSALTLLRLVDQRRLELDKPLSGYIPEFEVDDRITARQALSHTSGMIDWVSGRHDRGQDSIREYVAAMTRNWRQFEPGTVYSYSNPGYAAAALATERAGGRSFLEQAEAALAELGLTRSTFDLGKVLVRPHTVPHEASASGQTPMTQDPASEFVHDVPPGMLWMTAKDGGRWMEWLIAGPGANGVISSPAFAEMTKPIKGIAALSSGYGLGLVVAQRGGTRVISHGGGVWGHSAWYEAAPEKGCGVAIFANSTGFRGRASLVEQLMAELGGVPRTQGAPAQARPEHAGMFRHHNPDGGRQEEVVLAGGGIALKVSNGGLGPVRPPFRPDVFGAIDTGLIAYVRNASGEVVGLNLNQRHFAKT